MQYIRYVFFVTLILCCKGTFAQGTFQAKDHKITDSINPRKIIYTAVLLLLEPVAPNAQQVQHVLQNSKLFITKCNLCSGTKSAFQQYSKHTGKVATSGHAALFSTTDTDEQFDLLQAFVEKAIQQYIAQLSVPLSQKQLIKEKLKTERLNSIMRLNVKKCATCDAVEHK